MDIITEFKMKNRIEDANKIAYEFFAVYSRFEFALKNTIYVKKGNYDNAEAAWYNFANDNNTLFQATLNYKTNAELNKAVRYLFDNPPRKQKYQNEKLIWEEKQKAKTEDLKELLIIINDVRHNLFHGSKNLGIEDSSRDFNLLNNSMVVLNECLNVNGLLKDKFLEDQG